MKDFQGCCVHMFQPVKAKEFFFFPQRGDIFMLAEFLFFFGSVIPVNMLLWGVKGSLS